MKKKYEITSDEALKIRKIIKEYEKTSAFRKLQAIMLIGEGEDVQTVAKTTLYTKTWIYELVKKFYTQSFDEFVSEKRGGANNRNLTDEQETTILAKFEERAINGEVVSLQEIKEEYEKVRGKETPNSTFYDFLDRKNWRRVMPRGQHPKKASNEVIEASKKLTSN